MDKIALEKEILSTWNESDWIKIINELLTINSILKNIKFSSIQNIDRIIELYVKLNICKLPNTAYVNAVLSVFINSLNQNDVNQTRDIITIIGNIKPAYQFTRFARLAISSEYSEALDFIPDGDFSNRIYLLDALIEIDTNGWFVDFFMNHGKSKQDAGFYQVAVRYFHINEMHDYLYEFINNTEDYKLDTTALELISDGFLENIVDVKKLNTLYEFAKRACLGKRIDEFYKIKFNSFSSTYGLLYSISDYFIQHAIEIPKYEYFVPLVALLIPINYEFIRFFNFKDFEWIIKMKKNNKLYNDKQKLILYVCANFSYLQDIEFTYEDGYFILNIKNKWHNGIKRYFSSLESEIDKSGYLKDYDLVAMAINQAIENNRISRIIV